MNQMTRDASYLSMSSLLQNPACRLDVLLLCQQWGKIKKINESDSEYDPVQAPKPVSNTTRLRLEFTHIQLARLLAADAHYVVPLTWRGCEGSQPAGRPLDRSIQGTSVLPVSRDPALSCPEGRPCSVNLAAVCRSTSCAHMTLCEAPDYVKFQLPSVRGALFDCDCTIRTLHAAEWFAPRCGRVNRNNGLNDAGNRSSC